MIDVCRRVDKGETDEKETEKIERNLGLSFNCFTKVFRLSDEWEDKRRSAPKRENEASRRCLLKDH